ncbi:MAG: trypsin-like serine protease [bacterium]|nr:trypsin-like serine protease [bacterium]
MKILKAAAVCCLILAALCLQPQNLSALTEDEQNTIRVVKQSANSVVFITNTQKVRDFFYQEENVARGTGSGFVWDGLGHIVTNYHVIEDGDVFAVTLPNQQHRRARLVGIEEKKDIAVLKIEGDLKDLHPVKAGSSKDLLVGQKVVAIGNPFGFDHTVTTGIVSALERQMMGVGGVTIRDMIQTDASINPGNSGGPLLNSDGQLIGMNTMIYSKTGTNSGIGFAVPVDTIKKIVPQIIKYGKVIRPGIGISFLPDPSAMRLDIKGVIVRHAARGSAAYRAGLRGLGRDRYGQLYIKDVIVGIDDHKITSYDDLYNTLDNYRIGDKVTVTVNRDRQIRKVRLKLVRSD